MRRRDPAGRLCVLATLALALWAATACSHVQVALGPEGRAMRATARAWRGQRVALRQSHHYGELYDDNERILLSPYHFATLYHRVDLAGRPITPGVAHGLVPAGTVVVVDRVELPGPLTALHRMLNAPKDHVWVRLHLADVTKPLPYTHGRPLIVVLDGPIDTAAALTAAMQASFGPERDVAAWLEGLRPPVRAAVAHKKVMRGMDKAALLAAAGEPWRWLSGEVGGQTAEVGWWPEQEAWLVGGEVVELRPPRGLDGRN